MIPAKSGLVSEDVPRLVYILYFVGFAVPLAALAGLVLAYMKRDEVGSVARSHLDFQIRSFWLGLAALVAGGILSIVLIGWAVIALWTIWALARFITGFLRLQEGRPVADPATLNFTV